MPSEMARITEVILGVPKGERGLRRQHRVGEQARECSLGEQGVDPVEAAPPHM